MADDWQYKKSLMLLEETRYSEKTETLYGGPRRRIFRIEIHGIPVFVPEDVLSFLAKENGVKLPAKITCEECAHKREENGVLRCPYSTVDLDPKGYCSHGIPIAMAAKAPLDEHVKKAIIEGEWDDHA